jgi:hypothetical protein
MDSFPNSFSYVRNSINDYGRWKLVIQVMEGVVSTSKCTVSWVNGEKQEKLHIYILDVVEIPFLPIISGFCLHSLLNALIHKFLSSSQSAQ